MRAHYGRATIPSEPRGKQCNERPEHDYSYNDQPNPRSSRRLHSINNGEQTYQCSNRKQREQNGDYSVPLTQELANHRSVTLNRSLHETERITFEFRPAQFVIVRNLLDFA